MYSPDKMMGSKGLHGAPITAPGCFPSGRYSPPPYRAAPDPMPPPPRRCMPNPTVSNRHHRTLLLTELGQLSSYGVTLNYRLLGSLAVTSFKLLLGYCNLIGFKLSRHSIVQFLLLTLSHVSCVLSKDDTSVLYL